MDKTVKIRAFTDVAKSDVPPAALVEGQHASLELAQKTAQLEEEKSKSLELLRTIVQLRESLKQEQVKTSGIVKKAAELEAQAKEAATLVANELTRKTAQLEEEKKLTLEQMKMIEQLRESIRQDQARMADTLNITARLEAKTKEVAVLEAKVKDLSAVLGRISSIAAAGKLDGNS